MGSPDRFYCRVCIVAVGLVIYAQGLIAHAGIIRAIGKVAGVVISPVKFITKRIVLAELYAKGDWRMAGYVAEEK